MVLGTVGVDENSELKRSPVTAFVSSYTTSGEILEIPEKRVVRRFMTRPPPLPTPLSHLEVGRKGSTARMHKNIYGRERKKMQ